MAPNNQNNKNVICEKNLKNSDYYAPFLAFRKYFFGLLVIRTYYFSKQAQQI
jgi:hypothetical protein